jgi:RNA polymerase sigma factor FliA
LARLEKGTKSISSLSSTKIKFPLETETLGAFGPIEERRGSVSNFGRKLIPTGSWKVGFEKWGANNAVGGDAFSGPNFANPSQGFGRIFLGINNRMGPHSMNSLAPCGFKDAEKRERLLLEHLPQVKFIARRIHDRLPAQVPLDDLIHAGVVGLIDAVEKFDPRKNVQLKSYAKFRIRGAILDSLREMDWSPRHLRRQARRVEEAHRDLKLRLGRVATESELAKELEMSLEDFQHLLGELRGLDLGSLQAESLDPQSEEDLLSYQAGGSERDPFFLCLHGEMQSHISVALEDLDEKERQVVTLYYLEELTMREVGAVLGVGESRVSQIHSSAMIRLRARLGELMRSRRRPMSPHSAKESAQEGAMGKRS